MRLSRFAAFGGLAAATFAAAGFLALASLGGCDSPPLVAIPSDGGKDAPTRPAPSPFCPQVSELATCGPAPASGCAGSGKVCGPDALPTGGACSGKSQCAMAIDPCPDFAKYAGGERVDGYVCTCVAGAWSCMDCFEGASLCVESPDGAPYFGSQDAGAGAGADAGADADADAGAGADADASLSPD